MNLIRRILNLAAAADPIRRPVRLPRSAEPLNTAAAATVSLLQTYIRAAEAGETRQLFGLYRDLSLSGSHVQGELSKRKMALLGQPLSIQPGDTENEADAQAAEAVRWMVDHCENWLDGMLSLQDSVLWPVAVVEKVYAPVRPEDNLPEGLRLQFRLARLEPVSPFLLCFKEAAEPPAWEPGLRLWSLDAGGQLNLDPTKAEALDPARHIVHRGHMLTHARDCYGGPMRGVLFWWYLSLKIRDWWARFSERYGSPFPVGHTDISSRESVDLLRDAFADSVKIGGLVVDHECQVELVEAAAAGAADNYERFHTLCKREISEAICGQTLAGEAQATGLGSGVGRLHGEVRADLAAFDNARLQATLAQQLVRQFLEINGLAGEVRLVWGGETAYESKATAELLESLARASLEPTDEALPVLSERIGFPIQKKSGPVPGALGAVPPLAPEDKANRDQAKEDAEDAEDEKDTEPNATFEAQLSERLQRRVRLLTAQDKIAGALGVPMTWLDPVREFLAELEAKAQDQSLRDADLLAFLERAVEQVPELFSQMNRDDLAQVLEAGLGAAALEGMRESIKQRIP